MRKLKLLMAAAALCVGASTSQAKVDITATYLKNADLSTVQTVPSTDGTGWTFGDPLSSKQNGGVKSSDGTQFYYQQWRNSGGSSAAKAAIEFYHAWNSNAGAPIGETQNFHFTQTVTLPAGYYRLSVNAFYREGNPGNGTNNNKAWIFAGDKTQNIIGLPSTGVSAWDNNGGDDMDDAQHAFGAGEFENAFDFNLTEEKEITIGFQGYIDTYQSWCILGPVTLWEYTAADYMEDYRAKVAIATPLLSEKMNATVLQALSDAIVDESTLSTVDDVQNAVSTLAGAINNANSSIASYESLKSAIDAFDANYALLDTDGKAAADAAGATTAKDAYTNGTATDGATEKTTLNGAFRAGVLATKQPGDGLDMTAYVTNPDFNSGNDDGWTKVTPYGGNCVIQGGSRMEYWAGNASDRARASFNIYQELTNLPAGAYTISADMYNSLNDEGGDYTVFSPTCGVYGASDNEEVALVTVEGTTLNTYTTGEVIVATGNLTIGTKNTVTPMAARWFLFDNVKLTYARQLTSEEKTATYIAAITAANNLNGLIPTAAYNALQQTITDNTVTNGTAAEYNAAAAVINAAVENVTPLVAPYAVFNTLVDKANAIANVVYTETTSGSHTTFTDAITAQTTAANNATTTAAITEATNALIAAIKTYIAGAEPANDGEYFDITCLMVNPNFDDSHNGWTFIDAPGVNWSNCEYYEKEFDINQTVTGLPTGSYSLSVQAFQRPGWAGDVYNEYISGTDNASSVLYINSITSNVKNIAADAQDTYKLGDGSSFAWPNDSRVGAEGSYKYVPNSQQGAKLWFEAGLYDATCAAVVTSEDGGSLKLGFKSTKTHVGGDWTIFDNFRLYYYGSSLFVYYKQYLPQLKSEASADLSNALYANVTGKEKADFEDAIAATPAEETEAAYKAVIDNIIDKRTAFREAAPTYDDLVAAKAETKLDKITANVGTGVFQYNATTNDNLYTAYETAYNTMMATSAEYPTNPYATAANINMALTAYNTRKADYQNQTLNAPDADKRYYLNIVDDGQAWDGYAITFKVGDRGDDGLYNTKYEAPANVNLNQALKFTAVDGEADTYKVSGIRVENGSEQYLTTKLLAYGNGANGQLRTTDDATKAMRIKIQATTTNGQFKLLNVEANNAVIARNATNPDNGVYTDGDANFTIAEASQASIAINTTTAKWGTTILPFAVASLPEGVNAYTCTAKVNGKDNELNLVEVDALEANKPYIIEGEWNETKEGWGLGAATSNTVGWLTGVYAETDAPVGSYVLQKNNDVVGFYLVADVAQPKVKANRCYLTVPNSARAFFLLDSEATAIKAIETLTSGEAEIYNAAGARVPGLQKGMNIIRKADGQSYKVMVK